DALCLFILVHVASFPTDVSFVCFYLAGELREGSGLHRKPNPVKHEPRSFLRDADLPVNLVRADSILAVGYHPDRSKPLIKSNRRIFKNRSDLDGEFLTRMFGTTFP